MKVIEVLLIIMILIGLFGVWYLMRTTINRRVKEYYVHQRTKKIRKTNPCYRCPRSRKYVCDGCYVKLRKEYEHGKST